MAKQQIRTERHGESEGELRVGEGLRESKMAKQQIRTERHGERERERERERKGGGDSSYCERQTISRLRGGVFCQTLPENP